MCRLADAYWLADSLDPAIEIYRRAIALDSSRAYPYIGLADTYWRKQAYDTAAYYCRKGLLINPNFPNAMAIWKKIQSREKYLKDK